MAGRRSPSLFLERLNCRSDGKDLDEGVNLSASGRSTKDLGPEIGKKNAFLLLEEEKTIRDDVHSSLLMRLRPTLSRFQIGDRGDRIFKSRGDFGLSEDSKSITALDNPMNGADLRSRSRKHDL